MKSLTEELKKYILWYCRDWMLPEEVAALNRSGLTDSGEESTRRMVKKSPKFDKFYGFENNDTNTLVALGKEKLEKKIALRILNQYGNEVLNHCPKCGKLARTPKAKQCRYCSFDWH